MAASVVLPLSSTGSRAVLAGPGRALPLQQKHDAVSQKQVGPSSFVGSALRIGTVGFSSNRHEASGSLKVRATAEVSPRSITDVKSDRVFDIKVACPICQKPIARLSPLGDPSAIRDFKCKPCRRTFKGSNGYADLTISSQMKSYSETSVPRSSLFSSPIISYVYERGWRQSFAWAGFPGADEEFKAAMAFFEPVHGGKLLDLSCGSGLFARRFAKSGKFSDVVASDLSGSMLQQAGEFMREDPTISSKVALVRADAQRLPFANGSLDAVHAGAALHCWPSPMAAVAEISRVLRPGGIFVATTFLEARAPFGDEFIKPLRKAAPPSPLVPYQWFDPEDLEDLMYGCGFADWVADIRNRYIMLCVRRPPV
eukprot:jgi/Mesvir1/25657/Mv01874-RA.1